MSKFYFWLFVVRKEEEIFVSTFLFHFPFSLIIMICKCDALAHHL